MFWLEGNPKLFEAGNLLPISSQLAYFCCLNFFQFYSFLSCPVLSCPLLLLLPIPILPALLPVALIIVATLPSCEHAAACLLNVQVNLANNLEKRQQLEIVQQRRSIRISGDSCRFFQLLFFFLLFCFCFCFCCCCC